MTSCSLSTFSLSSRLFMLPCRSFRRTLREVLLDIYSRTSCSWRSLSPNFPENWKNMLLNAFLLTYVCGILLFFPVEDHEIRTSLSLSLSLFLFYMLHTFSFSAEQVVRILAPAPLCMIHLLQDSRQSSYIVILFSATSF